MTDYVYSAQEAYYKAIEDADSDEQEADYRAHEDAYHTVYEDADSDEQDRIELEDHYCSRSNTESGADEDPMYDLFGVLLFDHEDFWNECLSQDMGSDCSVRSLGE